MEEVDKIIIHSLKSINCDIDEDITSLKSFSPDSSVAAISSCLEIIQPGKNLPKRMPSSMSQRLRLATQLVEQVQSVGFRGDIGYQTILYSNEVELRRILMFLIERFPRENSKVGTTETIGFVPKLMKDIEDKMKYILRKPWVPVNVLQNGARFDEDTFFHQSFGYSTPLRTENVEVPKSYESTDALKNYWIHDLPLITQQCSKKNLIPTLLFKDNEFSINDTQFQQFMDTAAPIVDISVIQNESVPEYLLQQTEPAKSQINENDLESKLLRVLESVQTMKDRYRLLQEEVANDEASLARLHNLKNTEDGELLEVMNKLKVKSKTLKVLSKEEHFTKLKSLVDDSGERLVDLANQWNEVQTPLIEEYKELKNSLSQQELKDQEKIEKYNYLTNKVKQLEQDLLEKEQLEKNLSQEVKKINKNNNRSGYTRRILEIIANIKKQDGEIKKILDDTKKVQKYINNLSGQLDRSFTLSDGLIFQDAKHDEVARKAYKLLATLHFDCESVIQSVTDLGLIEREARNLQDQIDAELDKDIDTKLEHVLADIKELRNERMLIMKNRQQS